MVEFKRRIRYGAAHTHNGPISFEDRLTNQFWGPLLLIGRLDVNRMSN